MSISLQEKAGSWQYAVGMLLLAIRVQHFEVSYPQF
jgi:hypothetical protein